VYTLEKTLILRYKYHSQLSNSIYKMVSATGIVSESFGRATAVPKMPNLVPPYAGRSLRIASGFIKHPENFPLEVRKLRPWHWLRHMMAPEPTQSAGLKFFAGEALRLGSLIEVSISIRHGVQRFHAKVVMLRELDAGCEVGVWLLRAQDIERIRLVERICQLESDVLALHMARKRSA